MKYKKTWDKFVQIYMVFMLLVIICIVPYLFVYNYFERACSKDIFSINKEFCEQKDYIQYNDLPPERVNEDFVRFYCVDLNNSREIKSFVVINEND